MRISFLFIAVLFSIATFGQLRPARLFRDHVVLQRNTPVKVWGWSAPHDAVHVTLNNKSVKTTADKDGYWLATLPAFDAGGPYILKINNRKESILIKDVMMGEVWICSGQSNMEWPVKYSNDYRFEKEETSKYSIREFAVEKRLALEPLKDFERGEWLVASTHTVGDFSAVAYFFAKELSRKLNVTIGLIHASWGGSQAEGWISKAGMESSKVFSEYARSIPTSWEEANQQKDKKVKAFAFGDRDAVFMDADVIARQSDAFFQQWHTCSAPASWDWQGKWVSFRGRGFMYRKIVINKDEVSKLSALRLADKDGLIAVYINGVLVKEHNLVSGAPIELPSDIWKEGDNSLLLHLSSQSDPSWYGPGIAGNSDDLYLQFDSYRINLAGSDWRMLPDFKNTYSYEIMNNRVGTTLYNAMLHPIIPYSMRGVIWYQGETNSGRSFEYRTTFPLLINDWRRKWGSEFPFYFVQLSSFGGQQDSNTGSGWAELREAQLMTLSLPNTGMAVTVDIGDPDDVHPRNKQDVGRRLAAIALAKTYGYDNSFAGPIYKGVDFVDGKAFVTFDFVGNGLAAKDKYGYVKGFEIAGSDRVFHYAKATIVDGKVIVSSELVPYPVAVRYGWTDAPVEANLYNKDGFPATPFRTDDWPGVTMNNRFE